MASSLRVAWIALAGLLLLACPAVGQLQFGDFSTNLNGTLSAGYSGDYGNEISSSHGWNVGGSGNFSGYYYNPNFVSFSVSPYLDQSRANSDYQSISDASGVNFGSQIFGGTHFPGSISYSKAYNSEGNVGIPGIANFTTHGDSDTFGINWSALFPGLPSLSAGYQRSGSEYSVYGLDQEGNTSSDSFHVNSGYRLFGFGLSAYYFTGAGQGSAPPLLSGETETNMHSDSSGEGFNLAHALPLRGSFSSNVSRSDYTSGYDGLASSTGTIDTISSTVSAQPTNKLTLAMSANYSDNLAGQLLQPIVAAGGVVPGTNANTESHSLDLMGSATYSIQQNLQTTGFGERRVQYYLGQGYGGNSYGGRIGYSRGLLGGTFSTAVSLSDNTVDNSSLNLFGFSTTAAYTRQIAGWTVSGNFSYAQNVQTLLITYMSSYYSYGGSVRRHWGRLSFGVGAGVGRTGLSEQRGTSSSNDSYNANFGYGRWVTLTGTYTKADGVAVLTGAGLTPVPVTQPIPVLSPVSLFGGRSWSIGMGTSPAKRLTIGAAYSKAHSNFAIDSLASWTQSDTFSTLAQYQFRKMAFTCGFSRLEQGFSASTLPPEVISSFYIGVSRWFNFF